MHLEHLAQLSAFFALGGVLGFMGGLFGIGGGLFAIPILSIFFGLNQQHAQGTALVMVAPNVLVGLWRYSRYNILDRRAAIMLGCSAFPLTYFGADIATHIPSDSLRRAFALFLFALAVWMFARHYFAKGAERKFAAPWPWTGCVGAAGGALSGIFSVGGAIMAVPLLTKFFGLTQTAAQGMALAMAVPITLVGLGTYTHAHDVDWIFGIPLAIGGCLFVAPGAKLAHMLAERTLGMLFAGMLIASAIASWRV
jgi:uncharacterized membrane protein YfcA